jgi:hypothetical protein
MAAPQVEPIVIPLGLITQPNKLGQYPAGALSQALGVVMRSPGLLTKAPLLSSFNANPFITTSPCTPHLLLGVDTTGFWHVSRRNADSHWELTNFNLATKFGNDLSAAGLPYQPITFATDGRLNFTRSRDRYLFNSNQGILIVDTTSAGTNAAALPRMAGLPAPTMNSVTPTAAGNPGAVAANSWTSVVCIVHRTMSDGYEVLSAPSAPVGNGNNFIFDLIYSVYWSSQHQFIAGDVLEFYRTRSQPGTSETGSVYFYSTSYTLLPADIAAGIVSNIRDQTPDAKLGRELYTNPGQTGALSAKLPPGLSTCMATFKGYTFYGNRTDTPLLTLSIPYGMSQSIPSTAPTSRKNAIGVRPFTATFTNTSNVLTAISAADIVGLAIGQRVIDVAIATGSGVISAVGASTVTLSQNANTTVTKATTSTDMVIIDGLELSTGAWDTAFLQSFRTNAPSVYVAAPSSSPPYVPVLPIADYAPFTFALTKFRVGSGSFTIKASNPQNYLPVLPATTATALTVPANLVPNGIAWSEQQQPEAVPPVNTAFVGSGTIYGMWPTRDALWIFASDGLWRLSGTGGAAGRGFDWRIDPVDSTLSLAAPHAACVLRDTVYAYTNRGLVAISNAGVDDTLSTGKINDLLPGPPFAAVTTIQIAANETEDEIWLGIGMGTGSMLYYVYNTLTRVWTNTRGGLGNLTDVIQAYSRANQAMASIDTGASYLQSASQFEGCTVDYQPITTKDPFAMKQWLDATIVAASADAGKAVTPRFNGVAFNVRNLTSQNQDARTSWNVPRLAPAIANSLAPGFSNNLSSGLSIYGFSLRSVMLTSQRKQR